MLHAAEDVGTQFTDMENPHIAVYFSPVEVALWARNAPFSTGSTLRDLYGIRVINVNTPFLQQNTHARG